MKIAILVPALLVQGGGDRQAVYLARELQEMGHDVVVYTPTYDRTNCYPEVCSRLRIVVVGEHPLTHLPLLPERLRAFLNMMHLARNICGPFDIINTQHWPPHWAGGWAARRMSPAPAVVWMSNDPPWPPLVASRGIRRLLRPLRLLWRIAFLRLDRRLTREVSRIVVVSEYAKRLTDATYDTNCAIVRTGPDAQEFQCADASRVAEIRCRYGVGEDAFLLLSLGILMPHRRLEDAIAAVARVAASGHDIHYLIAGSLQQHPDYAKSLRRLVSDLGLTGRVTFAGAVSEKELKLHYHACDAFVFPNENQTWALVVTEAMVCGKPVVVSTGAAVSETLTDHQTALLVPPRDPDAIAAALTTLVEDEALRREIGERGRRHIVETVSWRRYAETVLGIFEEAIASEAARRVAAPIAGPLAIGVETAAWRGSLPRQRR